MTILEHAIQAACDVTAVDYKYPCQYPDCGCDYEENQCVAKTIITSVLADDKSTLDVIKRSVWDAAAAPWYDDDAARKLLAMLRQHILGDTP